ncbi:phage tail protein [Microvirga sp. 17 mud 1-3]|nr:phage tail protein [Microvirga sp. 17 mud 1-3]
MTPAFRLVANSADITAAILDRFVSLTLTDEAGMESDTFEVTLADHDPLAPIAMPATGAELEVFLGYDNMVQRMGLFVVDEVELSGWPGQMTIRGKAAPFSTSKGGKTDLQTQKSRSWEKGTKMGALVAKIAGEHGMEPAVSESLKSITLPHLDQTEESDISFLVRVAKRYDAIAKPAGGKLVMAKRGESKNASGEELPPILVHASQVSAWRMTLAKRESPGTVIAYYHQKRSAKRIEVKVGEGEPVRRLRHWYPDEKAAKDAAQAELDKRARGEHKFSLTMPGDPMLAAESPLVASGFRAGADGEWIVTRAVHSLSKGSGYQCDVEAEKPNDAEDDDGAGASEAA